jgi:DNA-binding PadR family transcriptional regulator
MPLPEITHLQFLVLGGLSSARRPGWHVRARLAEEGLDMAGPAFYQLMARLEIAGLVEGSYDEKVVGGQRIRERGYRITAAGKAACHRAYDFYLRWGRSA